MFLRNMQHTLMHTHRYCYTAMCMHIMICFQLFRFLNISVRFLFRLQNFAFFKSTLWQYLPEKSVSNASKLLKQCSTLAKQSGKLNISIFSKRLKFQASPKFCMLDGWMDGLPAFCKT